MYGLHIANGIGTVHHGIRKTIGTVHWCILAPYTLFVHKAMFTFDFQRNYTLFNNKHVTRALEDVQNQVGHVTGAMQCLFLS